MSSELPPGDPRVFLAIERTFLAWTRTALALMGFGFVVARVGLFLSEVALTESLRNSGPVADSFPGSLVLGCALIFGGVAVQTAAIVEQRRRMHRFRAGQSIAPPSDVVAMLIGFGIIAAGAAGMLYLLARAS